MSSVSADLHVHTRRSDGAVDVADLPARAAAAGLDAVAITDHDRLPPAEGPRGRVDGVEVIPGIELRVEQASGQRVDLLAYGLERTDALATRLEALQRNRIERAARMVGRLEATLEVAIDLDLERGVGRPHVAEAAAAASGLSTETLFAEYIGDDGPCYVSRDIPGFEEGRGLLTDAAELVVLAHPFRYDDVEDALAAAEHLDGVEYWYPYGRTVDTDRLDVHLERAGGIATGGSDAHTASAIGTCGVDADAFEAVADAVVPSWD